MIVSGGQAVDFAPQALGETVPLFANGYFTPDTGLTLSGKFATYAALYRVQPSIATLVDKIANAAARLSLKVWDTTPATGKVEDLTSPYARLLAQPTTFMSPFNFWRWTFSTYEVYGEAFWLKQRDSTGSVMGLLPMHPSRVSVKRDVDGNVIYVFSVGVASAGLLEVPAGEVVPFQRYNPDSLMRGMSRLEPLRSTMLNEDASRRATASWWQRGARPSVALKHPGELSAGAQSRLRANWEAQHAGADLMGGTAILEEGMEAQVIQLSAEEMQYIESRKMNLQEACMVYDVPPPVVHILDHATFSNITEQMRSMYRDTMAPRLEDVESTLDFHLRAEFFPTSTRAAKFSLDEVLRGDFETRAVAVGSLIEKGVYKPSEARPLFDLPEAGPEADKLYGNAALVPLGSSVHGQTEVNPGGDLVPSIAPSGAPRLIAAPPARALARSVLASVGRMKAAGGDVRQALVDGHAKELLAFFDGQEADLAAGKSIDDDALAEVLLSWSTVVSKEMGKQVAKRLGGTYDGGRIEDWLRKDATAAAEAINAKTLADYKAHMETKDATSFRTALQARAPQIAATRVATVGGLSQQVAAEQSGAATKTWVTGPSPRSSHASMDGETVGIQDVFSNGMNGPGDPAGGASEVAGCNCSLNFSMSPGGGASEQQPNGVPAGFIDEFGLKTTDVDADIKAINPLYDFGTEYQENCANAVNAYELRARGLDVVAKGNYGDVGFNEFMAMWRGADGRQAAHGLAMFTEEDGLRAIAEAWPEDSRGFMFVNWKTGGGHFMTVEKSGGMLRFIDPQTGEVFTDTAAELFGRMSDNCGVMRSDNLTATDAVRISIKKKP